MAIHLFFWRIPVQIHIELAFSYMLLDGFLAASFFKTNDKAEDHASTGWPDFQATPFLIHFFLIFKFIFRIFILFYFLYFFFVFQLSAWPWALWPLPSWLVGYMWAKLPGTSRATPIACLTSSWLMAWLLR